MQHFLTLELHQHRAELLSLSSKIGLVRSELTNEIEAAQAAWTADQGAQVRDALWFQCPGTALENAILRGDLSATREIAALGI